MKSLTYDTYGMSNTGGLFIYDHNRGGLSQLFVAADRNIPRIRIRTRQAASLAGKRLVCITCRRRLPMCVYLRYMMSVHILAMYVWSNITKVVRIDGWERTSMFPHGHFVKELGVIGDKETENEVLLLEHDVPFHRYSGQLIALKVACPSHMRTYISPILYCLYSIVSRVMYWHVYQKCLGV